MLSMQREAMEIQRLLAQNVPGTRVMPPPASFQTSKMRVYYLRVPPGPRMVQNVEAMMPAINQALTLARGQATTVTVAQNPLRIEVVRPDPVFVPLYPMLRTIGRTRHRDDHGPMALLGESYNFSEIPGPGEGRRMRPLVLDLARESTPHLLCGASTGGGKTRLLQSMVLSMALSMPPERLSMLVMDPKGLDFRPFGGRLPHMAADPIVEPSEAADALAMVVEEMERRKRAGLSRPDHHIVVVVDEVAELVQTAGDLGISANIRRILQVGRGLGIHAVLCTQHPTADFVGDLARDRVNLPARVVGRIAESQNARPITGIAGSRLNAQNLAPADFILVVSGRPRRFHAGRLDDADLVPAINGVARAWDGHEATWMLDLEAAERAREEARRAAVNEVRQVVAAVAGPATDVDPREAMAMAIAEEARRNDGQLPRPTHVVRAWKQQHGRSLNYNTAVRILSQAEQYLMQ